MTISQRTVSSGLAVLGLTVGACFLLASPEANAAGCNGVVAPHVWGCAPWDNNNGPQFPNYKPPKKAAQPAARPALAQQPPKPTIAPNAGGGRIMSRDGAGLIGNDGSTLVGNDGASMRRK